MGSRGTVLKQMLAVWDQFHTLQIFYKMVYNVLLFCVIWTKYFLKSRGQGLKMLFEVSVSVLVCLKVYKYLEKKILTN